MTAEKEKAPKAEKEPDETPDEVTTETQPKAPTLATSGVSLDEYGCVVSAGAVGLA